MKYIGIESSRDQQGNFEERVILGKPTDRETLETMIGDDINLILQYGLGDDFGYPTDDQQICNNADEDDIEIDGGHNPYVTFKGTDITFWYGDPDDDGPQEGEPFCRYQIIPYTEENKTKYKHLIS